MPAASRYPVKATVHLSREQQSTAYDLATRSQLPIGVVFRESLARGLQVLAGDTTEKNPEFEAYRRANNGR